MMELWGKRITFSLPSLCDPFLLEVIAPQRVPFMAQIELNYVLMLN